MPSAAVTRFVVASRYMPAYLALGLLVVVAAIWVRRSFSWFVRAVSRDLNSGGTAARLLALALSAAMYASATACDSVCACCALRENAWISMRLDVLAATLTRSLVDSAVSGPVRLSPSIETYPCLLVERAKTNDRSQNPLVHASLGPVVSPLTSEVLWPTELRRRGESV